MIPTFRRTFSGMVMAKSVAETMQGVRDSNRPSDVFSDTWGGTGNLPDACQRNLSRPVE